MKHHWSGDRAIGFVVGTGASFMLVGSIITDNQLPAIGGLILMAIGVFAPSDNRKR